MPPIVAVPRAAMSMPGDRPCSSAASCRAWSVTPEPAMATRSTGSIITVCRRSVERITCPGSDTPPSANPVRPPWVTTATPAARQAARAAETSSVFPGRIRTPASRLRASTPGCTSASSFERRRCSAPTMAESWSSRVAGTAFISGSDGMFRHSVFAAAGRARNAPC